MGLSQSMANIPHIYGIVSKGFSYPDLQTPMQPT